jgi:L-fuculose-phosphate aldolase
VKNGDKSIDLGGRKLIAMRDVQDALSAGAASIVVAANSIVTPSARDFLQQHGIELVMEDAAAASAPAATLASAAPAASAVNRRLFTSPEAEAVKKEICSVGRKLWMRQFVDGNGGNISYRIGPNEVLCTPTLVSKYDLTPDDIGMTDMEGAQIAGS